MFENIIGQDNVINLLKNDIINNSLSNSMVFYGKKNTGKLLTALELVRILNCEKDKNIDCECNNCKRIDELNFEGLIFLSRRDYSYILEELIASYKKNRELKYLKKILKIIKLISLPLQDFLIENVFSKVFRSVLIPNCLASR
jgi:DNA polymerase III delta prime subunit